MSDLSEVVDAIEAGPKPVQRYCRILDHAAESEGSKTYPGEARVIFTVEENEVTDASPRMSSRTESTFKIEAVEFDLMGKLPTWDARELSAYPFHRAYFQQEIESVADLLGCEIYGD